MYVGYFPVLLSTVSGTKCKVLLGNRSDKFQLFQFYCERGETLFFQLWSLYQLFFLRVNF